MCLKKQCIFFLALVLMVIPLASGVQAQDDPYKVIATQGDLDQVASTVQRLLSSFFSMTFRVPVRFLLVSGKKLDELYAGEYRGAQIGLYRRKGADHEIYMIEGKNKDIATGVTAHELTHAWQNENCVPGQSRVLVEGFASWIQYKVYQKTGAYILSQRMLETADPVYGVGFKRMLEWEDKLGERAVIQKAQKARTIDD